MSRTPIIAGNWKLHMNPEQTTEFVDAVKEKLPDPSKVESLICAPAVDLDALRKAGFSAEYIQFFPKPSEDTHEGDDHSVFFWNRREAINVNLVGKLFAKYPLKLLHIHKALDPNQVYEEPKKQYAEHIEYSTWYEQKAEMIKDIEKCAFYISPREKEGIGMSFLEAMAMGRVVVAPNQATMNEYIRHGENGYLYNLNKCTALAEKLSWAPRQYLPGKDQEDTG